jgi:hypothetical protein
MIVATTLLAALLSATAGLSAEPNGRAANGPLRVHPTNPRCFTDGRRNPDGSVRAIYLAGHQVFVDVQDNCFNKEWTKDMARPDDAGARSRLLDWPRYVDFAAKQRFNYLRGWIIWSTGSGKAAAPNRVAGPMPYLRTGPGLAADGKPKFDLRRFDEAFFRRLRDHAGDLGRRGVYYSVMLFELYGFLDGEAVGGERLWEGNVLCGKNNVQGFDIDRNRNRLGEEFFSLDDAEIVKLQKAYIEKMVDALADCDHILWEICNEAPSASFAWQAEMLRHLKACEARKPKQHPALLSPGGWTPGGGKPGGGWSWTPEAPFLESAADCLAVAGGWIDKANPKASAIRKPMFMDLDHVAPGSNDPALVWKAFTRGYHFNLSDHPFEQPRDESPVWKAVRANVGHARAVAGRVANLARMRPREDLASTGFFLADEGREYVVYVPSKEKIRIRGLPPATKCRCEWFDTAKGAVHSTVELTTAAAESLEPPCAGAVLLLTLAQTIPQRPQKP